jgi:hypothetical protein
MIDDRPAALHRTPFVRRIIWWRLVPLAASLALGAFFTTVIDTSSWWLGFGSALAWGLAGALISLFWSLKREGIIRIDRHLDQWIAWFEDAPERTFAGQTPTMAVERLWQAQLKNERFVAPEATHPFGGEC